MKTSQLEPVRRINVLGSTPHNRGAIEGALRTEARPDASMERALGYNIDWFVPSDDLEDVSSIHGDLATNDVLEISCRGGRLPCPCGVTI